MTWAIEPVLDEIGLKYNPQKTGNQPIMCPNPEHEDSHPSASLNLGKGLFNCLACGEGGSAVDLLMLVKGIELREALRLAEAMDAGDSREVSPGSGHNSVGLPGSKGHKPRTVKPVPAWRGFRS